MHAVLVSVEIEAERADEVRELLDTFTIPRAKQARGFISGTWMRSVDGTRGRGVILLESQDAANALVSLVSQGPPAGAPVRFVSAEVFEVLAQA
jgi:hypothetical protein